METILHFDKLFYHHSPSDVSPEERRTKRQKIRQRKKGKERTIVKGDKVEMEKLLFIRI